MVWDGKRLLDDVDLADVGDFIDYSGQEVERLVRRFGERVADMYAVLWQDASGKPFGRLFRKKRHARRFLRNSVSVGRRFKHFQPIYTGGPREECLTF